MKALAVTGLGVVSPLGVGREAFVKALETPEDARMRAFCGPSEVLKDDGFAGAQVAEVRGFDAKQYLGSKGLRNFDRMTCMLIVAAKHALEDAGIKQDGEYVALAPERVGIISATAYGALDSITELNRVAELEHPRYLNPSRFPNTVINSAAGYVGIWEDLQAPNVTVVNGNCGALDSVLTAETHLSYLRADAFLVGGAEVLSGPLYLACSKLGIAGRPDTPCEPGAVYSRGAHLGEGTALLCVEPRDFALERGARVLAEIVGYGASFQPPAASVQLVYASPESVERAARMALVEAGLEPGDIDLVVSAESGITRVDAAESEGLARVFGAEVATIAPKALWGETFGAAGALGMAAAVAWLGDVQPAPLLRGALTGRLEHVLVTSMGYYGTVSAVVLRRAGNHELD